MVHSLIVFWALWFQSGSALDKRKTSLFFSFSRVFFGLILKEGLKIRFPAWIWPQLCADLPVAAGTPDTLLVLTWLQLCADLPVAADFFCSHPPATD